jgi:hypothetical protein
MARVGCESARRPRMPRVGCETAGRPGDRAPPTAPRSYPQPELPRRARFMIAETFGSDGTKSLQDLCAARRDGQRVARLHFRRGRQRSLEGGDPCRDALCLQERRAHSCHEALPSARQPHCAHEYLSVYIIYTMYRRAWACSVLTFGFSREGGEPKLRKASCDVSQSGSQLNRARTRARPWRTERAVRGSGTCSLQAVPSAFRQAVPAGRRRIRPLPAMHDGDSGPHRGQRRLLRPVPGLHAHVRGRPSAGLTRRDVQIGLALAMHFHRHYQMAGNPPKWRDYRPALRCAW